LRGGHVETVAVNVLIRLERQQPPVGTVVALLERESQLGDDAAAGWAAPVPFVGWLGLLRALAEAMGAGRDLPEG
jgi:hypothetical protein